MTGASVSFSESQTVKDSSDSSSCISSSSWSQSSQSSSSLSCQNKGDYHSDVAQYTQSGNVGWQVMGATADKLWEIDSVDEDNLWYAFNPRFNSEECWGQIEYNSAVVADQISVLFVTEISTVPGTLTGFKLYASNTGAFSGEEVLLKEVTLPGAGTYVKTISGKHHWNWYREQKYEEHGTPFWNTNINPNIYSFSISSPPWGYRAENWYASWDHYDIVNSTPYKHYRFVPKGWVKSLVVIGGVRLRHCDSQSSSSESSSSSSSADSKSSSSSASFESCAGYTSSPLSDGLPVENYSQGTDEGSMSYDRDAYDLWNNYWKVTNAIYAGEKVWGAVELLNAEILEEIRVQRMNTWDSPTGFKLYASNTGAWSGEEELIHVESGLSWSSADEIKIFPIKTQEIAYNHFKFVITGDDNPVSETVYIRQVTLHTCKDMPSSSSESVSSSSLSESKSSSSESMESMGLVGTNFADGLDTSRYTQSGDYSSRNFIDDAVNLFDRAFLEWTVYSTNIETAGYPDLWVQVDLPIPKIANKIGIESYYSWSTPTEFEIWGSNSQWFEDGEVLIHRASPGDAYWSSGSEWKYFEFENDTEYKKYRIVFSKEPYDSSDLKLYNIELYEHYGDSSSSLASESSLSISSESSSSSSSLSSSSSSSAESPSSSSSSSSESSSSLSSDSDSKSSSESSCSILTGNVGFWRENRQITQGMFSLGDTDLYKYGEYFPRDDKAEFFDYDWQTQEDVDAGSSPHGAINFWPFSANKIEWVQIDLGSPKRVCSLKLQIWDVSDGYVKKLAFYGSNTGAFEGEESIIHRISGISFSSDYEIQEFYWTCDQEYQYIRIICEETSTGSVVQHNVGKLYACADDSSSSSESGSSSSSISSYSGSSSSQSKDSVENMDIFKPCSDDNVSSSSSQ